jgi:hypothetical protein
MEVWSLSGNGFAIFARYSEYHVLFALPGYFTVDDLDDSIELGEPVIAWRVETYKKDGAHDFFSACIPLIVYQDAPTTLYTNSCAYQVTVEPLKFKLIVMKTYTYICIRIYVC